MLGELLASAGIEALVEDSATTSVDPPLQFVMGGAKVLVPAAEAVRAREICAASGVFPGGAEVEDGEIGEEEWKGSPSAQAETAPAGPAEPERAVLARRAVGASLLGLLLSITVVVPLVGVWQAARFYRTPGPASRGAHARVAFSLLVDALALALAALLWMAVATSERKTPDPLDRRHAPADRTPRRPFP
jgi:hypothetical protein